MARAVGRVIVGQLLTLADVPGRHDPDRVSLDHRVAVRGAGVIDEAGDVPPDGRVPHIQAIQLEAPDVSLLQVAVLAIEADLVWDLLPVVGHDAFVLVDGLCGKDSPAGDPGFTALNHV